MGPGGRIDGEEGGLGRKEGRGEFKNEKVVKMKKEKGAKGCIIGLAGPCFKFIPNIFLEECAGRKGKFVADFSSSFSVFYKI